MASYDGFWNSRKREKISSPVEKPRKRRRLGIMPLEPRIMYDGAAAATAAHHHHSDHHADHGDGSPGQAPPPATASGQPQANGPNPNGHDYGSRQADWSATTSANQSGLRPGDQVVFVDSTIANYQAIVAAINPGTKVFVFDGTKDGLQQIAQDLQGVHGLASIDVITHGAEDQVQVGTDTLTTGTIANYSADLTAIGKALAPNGQLDLYGCDVAAGGDGFLDALKTATGRNVAASTDLTGAAALGGDWKLEASTGPTPAALPANLAALQSFDNLLGPTAQIEADSGSSVTLTGTATDSAGDIFVVGNFTGTLSLGKDAGGTAHSLTSASQAGFVVEYNSAGTFVRDFQITGSLLSANSIAASANGNLVAVGGSNSTGGFAVGLSPNSATFNTAWSDSVGDRGSVDKVVYDSKNNEFAIAGEYTPSTSSGSLSIAGGSIAFANANAGFSSNFVAELNSNGGLVWGNTITSAEGQQFVGALAVDNSGNVYIAGSFESATFGKLSTSPLISLTNGNFNGGAYLAEVNSSGFQWEDAFDDTFTAGSIGHSGHLNLSPLANDTAIDITGIAFNASGQPIITGAFQDGAELVPTVYGPNGTLISHGSGTKTLNTFVSSGNPSSAYSSSAVFVEQLSSSTGASTSAPVTEGGSDTAPANSFAGLVFDQPTSIVVDQAGNIVVGGNLQSSASNLSASFGSKTIQYDGQQEAFVWDLTQVGTTNAAIGYPGGSGSPASSSVAGLEPPASGGGVVAVFGFVSQVDGITTSQSGATGGAFIGLTPLGLGEATPPVLGATGNTTDFWQSHNAAATLDGGITVTDTNGVDITGATVTISSGFLSGDTLGIPAADITSGKITGTNISFSLSGDQLTLSGSDTAAHYQTALGDVTYNFSGDPTNAGADKTRTITWSVSDADNLTSAAGSITTLDVFAAPVVHLGSTTTVTDNSSGSAVLADSGVTVTDANGTTLASATIVIGGAQTGDTLADNGVSNGGLVAGTSIHATFSGDTLTLSGSDTLAHYITALDEVQFSAVSPNNGTRTLTWTVDDQAGGQTNDSSPVTTTVIAAFGPAVTGVAVNGTEGASTGSVTVATFTDSTIANATAGDFTATINWGDGSAASPGTVVALGGGQFAVTGAHTYAEEGSDTISVAVTDSNNVIGNGSGSATVADAALTAGTATVTGGVEGVTAATLSATFADANPGAPATDFSGTIAWGDGTTSAFTSAAVTGSGGSYTVSGSHLYAEDGTHAPVVVTINDDGGSTTTDTGTTTVADAPLTTGTATVTGGVEGVTAATLSATFTDANTGATTSDFSGTIAWGDGTTTAFTSAAVTGSGGSYTVSGSHLYAEDGTYAPVVTINDVGGSTTTDTGTTKVADASLTAGIATVSGGVEGVTPATLSATFTDANTGAPTSDFSGTIAWGDGTTTAFTSAAVTGSGGSYTVSGSHLYAEDGTHAPVVVTINDVGGSSTTDTGTTAVADAPLTAGTATATGGVEGVTAAVLSATFTDANTSAPTSDFSGTIAWGDGTTTAFTSAAVTGSGGSYTVSGSHLYAEDGTHAPVVVTINDVGGSTTTDTGTAAVADAPLTVGTATVTGGVEGITAATLSATFTDANTGATASDFSGTIAWGDGTTSAFTSAAVAGSGGSYTVSGSHLYAEDGTYAPVVTINDVGGSTTTDTGTTKVADASLTAGIATVSGGVEGVTPATLSATFTDANTGAPTSDFSGTIAWGDGTTTAFTSAAVTGSGGSYTVSGSHLYAEDGTHAPVVVTINDAGGSSTTDTAKTTVADAPLTAAGTTLSGTEGAAFTATVATFTDANPNAPLSDFTATIDWGDGTTTSGVVAQNGGSFAVTGTHAYAVGGVYNANVAITDIGGSTAQASDTVDAVPSAPAITALVGQPVNGATVELKGTGEIGDTVNLFADGDTTTIVGHGTVVAGGTFDIVTTNQFKDGVHTFTATETDAANLTSAVSTPVFSVNVDPSAPTITVLVGQPVNGGKVELQGTGENGETVNLYADGNMTTVVGTGTVVGGTFDITTTATFADGVHNFTATETDTSHLTSTASTPAFSVNVDPSAPLITAVVGTPANNGTVELQGTGENGETVNLYADGNMTTVVGTGTVGSSGTFDIMTTATFPAGVHSFTATETDKVSLTSTASTPPFPATVIPPTVVAGADVDFQAGPGKSVVLDPTIGVYDGTSLTGATVTIASGFQPGEVLSANTAGTNITASYSNGVLTLAGKDTPQDYQLVLSHVTMSGSAPISGAATIDWQIADKTLTSKVATSTVEVTASLAPPPPSGQTQGQTPPNVGHTPFGDFSGMLTNVNAPTGEFGGLGFGAGGEIHVVHADVTASIGDNGNVAFNLPLDPLEAALDGDVVSVTASLPDGKPLPTWLQFNAETGKFAGLVPDDILTGSIGPDGGFVSRPDSPVQPQSITIEVIARDSRGNISIMDFTVDLSVKTLHKADKHGWNVLPGGLDPWGEIRPPRDLAGNSGDGLHRGFALPVTADHVPWHDRAAIDIDHAQSLHATDLPPAGRAGLSDQFKAHGWRAASAERMALLESLRQVATSWR